MLEADRRAALVPNPELALAAVYEREIEASLERVWENVHDWEHLPWLHSEAFSAIELLEEGDWGWRARVVMGGDARAEIELVTDRPAGRYVARTIARGRAGAGAEAPSEIWTTLDAVAPHRTAIRVEFRVQPLPEDALRKLGQGYVSLYTLLWNQDEEMMRIREEALSRRADRSSEQTRADPVTSLSLGNLDSLRAKLPLVFEFGGHGFRLLEEEGELIVHATECPHLFGPLGDCPVEEGVIECPWHGYRFDVRSGSSTDGRPLRLRPAPRVRLDRESGEVIVSRHGSP